MQKAQTASTNVVTKTSKSHHTDALVEDLYKKHPLLSATVLNLLYCQIIVFVECTEPKW